MSVAEIIEQVKRMTPEEQEQVQAAIADLRNDSQRGPREINPGDPGVADAMDKVFETHRELFRRLAQ